LRRRLADALSVVLGLAALGGCSQNALYAVTRPPVDGGDGDSILADGGADANAGSPGCGSSALAAGDTTRTVQVKGTSRTYLLHVPRVYDGKKPAPLVVDFHGIGQTGASERDLSPYPDALDAAGVLMAFPDGTKGPAGTAWDVGPCCVADVDDIQFARLLVADVAASACLDTKRVYAVGVLTGGGMAHVLGCRAADVFAAIAPAAFDLLAENLSTCVPGRAVTAISFRGTDDPKVPYEGGSSALIPTMPVTFLGAQGTFAKWAEIDGCTGAPSSPDADGCSRYGTCRDGAEVVLCTKDGGGSDPGSPAIAWPILMRHSL
jgi:polyhydroxybutyrate depolymerase